MKNERIKEIVKNNIGMLKTILGDLITPQYHEVKDMLLGQLDVLNTNIGIDIDKEEN